MGIEGAYLPKDNRNPKETFKVVEKTLGMLRESGVVDPKDQQKILEAAKNRLKPNEGLQTISSDELIKRYQEFSSKPVEHEGLYTGLETLDGFLLGVQPKNFMVICARTGVGKTLIANYMVAKFAEQGEKILYLALEENEQEVGDRWSKIVLNNSINVPGDSVSFSYSEMISAIKEDKYNLIALIGFYAELGYTMICVDMLNNLIDTVRDEDGNKFLNQLVGAAQANDMTLIMTARLRQPQSDREKDFPSMDSVYGRVDLGYVVSKCIAVTQLPDEGDGMTCLRLHILKNRRKRIGMKKVFPKIKVDNLLKVKDAGDDDTADGQWKEYENSSFGGFGSRTRTSSPINTAKKANPEF